MSPYLDHSSIIGITGPAVAPCTWHVQRQGLMAEFYAPLSNDPTPQKTKQLAGNLAGLLQVEAPTAPGWNLAIAQRLRIACRAPNDEGFRYTGTADAISALHSHYPCALRVDATDKNRGEAHFLVSGQSVAPELLLSESGRVAPASKRSRGALAIDLARALDAPCLLMRDHDRDPSVAFLHRCASVAEQDEGASQRDRKGLWRITFVERIGPTSHEYVDPAVWIHDVQELVGNAIHHGHRTFVGHRPTDIDPRLQFPRA